MITLWNERLIIKADRWPWQKHITKNNDLGRFGGGWNYKIGIDLGGFSRRSSVILNLIFGMIRISWDLRSNAERKKNKFGS